MRIVNRQKSMISDETRSCECRFEMMDFIRSDDAYDCVPA